MLLFLCNNAGFLGALEVPDCFTIREDVLEAAENAGLSIDIRRSNLVPTDSERHTVRWTLGLIRESLERKAAAF